MPVYDEQFYAERDKQTRASAQAVLSLVRSWVPFDSIIDVGCAVGTWLDVAKSLGASDIFGVEGEWVDPAKLVIPADHFLNSDLRKPLAISKTYDLAMSLEVAEHLPGDCADAFVKTLTSLAPVVLFSGAVPRQRGVGHVNEQWPDYWTAKFRAAGYVCYDIIRPRVWADESVLWWYSQNAMLMVRESSVAQYAALQSFQHTVSPARLVHPLNYLDLYYLLDDTRGRVRKHENERASLKQTLKDLKRNTGSWIGRRLGRK
jgi:hypothetical protein